MTIVHTTASYYINSIMSSNTLKPSPCNVFKGENLNYFFYGKPSYRIRDDARQSEEWQLPMCFIVDIDAISSIKRIYPFDLSLIHI